MARSKHTARTMAQAFCSGASRRRRASACGRGYKPAVRIGTKMQRVLAPWCLTQCRLAGVEVARATVELAVRRVVGALADLAGGHHLPVVVRQRLQLALGDLPAAIVGDAARRRYPGQQPRVGVVLAGERNTGDRQRSEGRGGKQRRSGEAHAGSPRRAMGVLHAHGEPRRSWSVSTWLFFSWHE